MIAASLLELTYGNTYETLMVDRIFRPLGMDSCTFGVPPRVMAHKQRSAGPPIQWTVITTTNPRVFNSAARISCSLKDWGKFLREYIRYDNSALLPPSSYAKILNSTRGYEAGFVLGDPNWSDEPYLFHNGSVDNYSIVWVSPTDDIAIIVFANAPVPDSQLQAIATPLGGMYAGD
jgi:CubicO group peptidase (beta-lactamase class C family)